MSSGFGINSKPKANSSAYVNSPYWDKKKVEAVNAPAIEHQLIQKKASGHGSWKECTVCGCTNHSGHWWFAGYKSKEKPSCSVVDCVAAFEQWKKNAVIHSDGE